MREFLDLIGKNDDIVRFEYLKKSNKEKGPALIGVETNDRANFSELARKMKEKGISFEDITENEIYFSLLVWVLIFRAERNDYYDEEWK